MPYSQRLQYEVQAVGVWPLIHLYKHVFELVLFYWWLQHVGGLVPRLCLACCWKAVEHLWVPVVLECYHVKDSVINLHAVYLQLIIDAILPGCRWRHIAKGGGVLSPSCFRSVNGHCWGRPRITANVPKECSVELLDMLEGWAFAHCMNEGLFLNSTKWASGLTSSSILCLLSSVHSPAAFTYWICL